MSDNLKFAKECGATENAMSADGAWNICMTEEAFEAYTSRILASQQAAHEAEIAKLKEEALKDWEATFNKWIEGAAWHIGKEKLSFDEKRIAFFAVRDFVQEAISESPQQVSEWERKQLEPLRAQVAMLNTLVGKAAMHVRPTCTELYEQLIDGHNHTQATAEQFIAECEQRVAVKVLEDAINYIMSGRINSANGFQITEKLRCRLEELRATSKKAG